MMKRFVAAAVLAATLVAASVALAAGGIAGTYTTTISGKGPGTLNGVLDGKWKLTLKRGKYHVLFKGKDVVNGNYKVKKSVITVNDTSGPGKCKGTGKYKYTLKNDTLRLKKISDTKACAARQAVLSHSFKKVS
jgi:hypothetical protein